MRCQGGCRRAGHTGAGRRRRSGPGPAGPGGCRSEGAADPAGRHPDPAAASAWSRGARTCPGVGVAWAPEAANGRRLHLSWGQRETTREAGPEDALLGKAAPQPPTPASVPTFSPPLAGVAFTVLVLFTKEAIAVEAGHLIPWLDVPERLHACSIPICRHKLGASCSAPGVQPAALVCPRVSTAPRKRQRSLPTASCDPSLQEMANPTLPHPGDGQRPSPCVLPWAAWPSWVPSGP